MSMILENSAVTSSKAWHLYERWAEHRCDRRLPKRSDIDPNKLVPILPDLFLTAMEYSPFRVRYRLVGTRIVEYAGFDYTGRYLDQLSLAGPNEVGWKDYFLLSCEQRDLVSGHGYSARRGHQFEFMILPLSSDGETVDQCIGVIDYEIGDTKEIRALRQREKLHFPLKHTAV